MSVPQQPPYSYRRSVCIMARKKQEFPIPYIMGSFEICDCMSCVAIGKWTEERAIYNEVRVLRNSSLRMHQSCQSCGNCKRKKIRMLVTSGKWDALN